MITGTDETDHDEDTHLARAGVEATIRLLVPTAYYWRTQEHQAIDWTLGWDLSSWERKLITFDAVKFDTNPFYVNTIRHPLSGALDYQIARTNGFGMFGSTVFAFGAGAVWEYFIEYRENPSINDMIMNTSGGIAIGEPMWQLGQIWRGRDASLGDRALSAALSPVDALHDTLFGRPRWMRPRAWHSFALEAGVGTRTLDDDSTQHELRLAADTEVIADSLHASDHDGKHSTKPGAWSRLRASVDLSPELSNTFFHSRTSIVGTYRQHGGMGMFTGLGSAFTYRKDRTPSKWDHVAFAHLVGPQIQLSQRAGEISLRWDAAAYVDFALVEANAFAGQLPFPPAPPYLSTLQANGYYHGAGTTASTRLRAQLGDVVFDGEFDAHRIRQINERDSGVDAGSQGSGTARAATTMPDPHHAADTRLYWRSELGFRPAAWGAFVFTEGAYRRGTWHELDRATREYSVGVLTRFDF